MEEDQLILRDKLAIDRTRLANERTFLAYFRASIFFVGTGISIVQIQFFENIIHLGWGLISLGPIVLLIGIYRLIHVKRRIGKTIYASSK
jgi:putative membrane protein